MKRISLIMALLATLVVMVSLTISATAASAAANSCTTIQKGVLVDSTGSPLVLGYDQFGYNYQAHIFNGTYDSSDRVLDGLYWGDPASADYADDSLIMKWSDPWLANVDCNGDGKLDRGLGTAGWSTNTSEGWTTNQINGDYTNATGLHKYTQFDKIVWVGPGGSLWGEYQIVQDVLNDSAGGFHGLQYKVGAPGFGLNDGWTN